MPNIKNKIKEACSLQKPVILKLPPMISAVEENASSFGLIIPLLCGEGTRGVLILNIADSHQMDDADLRLWQAFGATSTAAIQNSLLHERIQQMAITDTLTGINNRRGFELLARQQIKHAQRYEHTMCFLMLDLDHFKNVNDHYGHPAGDQVLVEVSSRLADTLREADLLGRYGGEEFTILLTNCSQDEGKSIGNRLLERVREKPVLTETGEIPVTLSIGLACGESRLTLEALIEKADQALYRAKQAGRDQMQT
jgi:diguanylate cyclase (GGDEF)-like protein